MIKTLLEDAGLDYLGAVWWPEARPPVPRWWEERILRGYFDEAVRLLTSWHHHTIPD